MNKLLIYATAFSVLIVPFAVHAYQEVDITYSERSKISVAQGEKFVIKQEKSSDGRWVLIENGPFYISAPYPKSSQDILADADMCKELFKAPVTRGVFALIFAHSALPLEKRTVEVAVK